MPIYGFYKKSLATQEEIDKYEKYSDVIVRMEERSAESIFAYVGVKKSQVRYEEQRLMMNIDRTTLVVKISEYKEESKAQSQETAPTPKSTFNLECKTEDELAARSKAELPYFVGEHDEAVDKSKLFEVDEADRQEALAHEIEEMDIEEDEEY